MAPAGPKPDAEAVVAPEPPALGLLGWHLQTFLPPDPRHPLGIDMPALRTQQCRDPAIAVPAKLTGQIDDGFGKRRFVIRLFGNMPLGRTRLAKHLAGPAFGNAKRFLDMMHAAPTTLNAKERSRAQKFPAAASFRMSLSSVRSATAFFSRAFSRSSSFRRLA